MLLVLDELGSEGPVVLALEDLHWADASTLDLLAFLAHGTARSRALLVGTYRTEEARTGEALHRLASSLVAARAATSLVLDPLDREAVEGLVRSASDAAPSDALVEKIFKRSEGNPLFAHQLLTASLRGDATLPPALRDMLLADVGRLPEESRWVLRVTAARDATPLTSR